MFHYRRCSKPTPGVGIQAHVFRSLLLELTRGCEQRLEHHRRYHSDFAWYHCKDHHLSPHLNDRLRCQVQRCCSTRIDDLSLQLSERT
jgi:hypothetical protein